MKEIDENVRSAMKYISDMDQSNLYYGVLTTQDPTLLCEMTETRRKSINRLKNEKFCQQKFIGTEVSNVCFDSFSKVVILNNLNTVIYKHKTFFSIKN